MGIGPSLDTISAAQPAGARSPAASLHSRKAERLRVLARYDILDTPREQDFDDIAVLASEICDTPTAVVNLIADGRQWFKAEVGLGVRETPLETSFCGHAILEADFLVVPDAMDDPRFAGNPLVMAAGGIRFYAGALLKSQEGLPLGSLCVLDARPRTLTERQTNALSRLARQVMTLLELRRSLRVQELLTDELQHRVKNTLATVQAIANQTFKSGTGADETAAAFTARLVALGKAHDLLTRENWSAAPIDHVIEGVLGAHGRERIDTEGPALDLSARRVLSLALALHELATNAAKYGALSVEGGRVSVRWQVEADRLRLVWQEGGGPAVSPPTRQGFGSRLIERSLSAEFGAEVRIAYDPQGLRCIVEAPLTAA